MTRFLASAGSRRPLWLALAVVLGTALVAGAWGYERTRQAALAGLAERGESTLNLAVTALYGQIRRFDRLPGLLARQEVVRDLLHNTRDANQILQTNLYLKATAHLLQASDIYIMALDGTTLAASNYDTDWSFVGGNFAFRPYFTEALSHGTGRFYALGTTSLVRGYYFGAPIMIGDAPSGVLVIKIDLDAIERSWRGSDYEVIVTDPEGVVFMSSHPDWTYGATLPLTPDRRARIDTTRRYAGRDLPPLSLTQRQGPGAAQLWRMDGGEYLTLSQPMPDADWTVHVLTETASADAQALVTVLGAGMLAALAGLGSVVIWQRRIRLQERLALQAEAQLQLERRVIARTAELAAVNRRLEDEVAERRATEERLRTTQAELVQAAKLAALGQMSAALSHEFNQPLGAARNFAENADLLLERGRVADARGNLARILSLIERLGSISKHLRNFARSPNARLQDVCLAETVAAVREILDWRLRAEGVTLSVEMSPGLTVRAGPVRLQQVLVNILSNAIDAVDGQPRRNVELTARLHDGRARIEIADTGAGIAPGLLARIFDPFFTTKGVGRGLGLGLSISYNIIHDFGGTLTATNRAEGGAVFVLDLPLAEPAEAAA